MLRRSPTCDTELERADVVALVEHCRGEMVLAHGRAHPVQGRDVVEACLPEMIGGTGRNTLALGATGYQNFQREMVDRWNANGCAFPGVTTTRTQATSGEPGTSSRVKLGNGLLVLRSTRG